MTGLMILKKKKKTEMIGYGPEQTRDYLNTTKGKNKNTKNTCNNCRKTHTKVRAINSHHYWGNGLPKAIILNKNPHSAEPQAQL